MIIVTCILIELSPHNHFFIIDACPGHILESTKGIEIEFGTYIYVNERKCRRQDHNPILHFTLVISP